MRAKRNRKETNRKLKGNQNEAKKETNKKPTGDQ